MEEKEIIKEEEKRERMAEDAETHKSNPIMLSLLLLQENNNFVRIGDNLYSYNGKCYDLVYEDTIKKLFHRFVIDNNITMSWRHLSSVVQSVMSYNDLNTLPRINDEKDNDFVCINNGVLDIKNKELLPHSPEYTFDCVINIDYEKGNYDCPHFIQYLHDTFNNDDCIVENIIRIGGYLMDRTNKAGKIFIFNGNGGSGKSTLMDIFLLFFNEKQVSSLSLNEIAGGNFKKEPLITSLANFTAEASKGYVDAEEIKKIATGDLITIEPKFKVPVTFRPKTKLFVACNGLPKFRDTSDGIYRRLIIIPFNNIYRSEAEIKKIKYAHERGYRIKDYELLDKIKKEKSAIFNMFIDGLSRLRADKYEFVESDNLNEELQDYRHSSDSVREFFDDWYEVDMKSELSAQDIYYHYRTWYRENVQESGAVKLRIAEIGKRIRETFGILPIRKEVFNRANARYERLAFYNLKIKDYGPEDKLLQKIDVNFNKDL